MHPFFRFANRGAIRSIAAFVAGELAAAAIFAAEFTAEADMKLDTFLVTAAISLIVGLPFVLFGAVPLWMVLRLRRIQSPWMFAFGGIAIALGAYLLVGVPASAPSDRPMTFSENLGRPIHIRRIAASMIAGGTGALVFWSVAVMRSRERR